MCDSGAPVLGHGDNGFPESCTVPSCLDAAARGDRWVGPFLSIEADGRAHFHHRDTLHARVRAENATRFTELAAAFEADPDDFVVAWQYLCAHPIFHRPIWLPGSGRTVAELSESELAGPPRFVEDTDGLQDLWLYVERDTDGAAVIHLEHGPHLWPHDIPTSEHWCTPADGLASHDLRLNVSGPSYEMAIVALAGRVRTVYGHDRSRV
jgi:hypothetical protein